MQLLDEPIGPDVDARSDANLLQECDQALVGSGMSIGQHLANVARIRESLALGHAQEQASEPVRKIAADEQQVIVFELVKQPLRRQMLVL